MVGGHYTLASYGWRDAACCMLADGDLPRADYNSTTRTRKFLTLLLTAVPYSLLFLLLTFILTKILKVMR